MSPMKILCVIVWWVILSATLQAQTTLSGMVTDSLNIPIPYASVYLAKTTYGNITTEKGTYSLTIPEEGTYELVASSIGYESETRRIKLKGQQMQINFSLKERPILIKEVTVKDKDKNRPQNYEKFLRCFIGMSAHSPYCTIDNPKDLVVYRDSEEKNLIAYSKQPLIITNSALGYKIMYDLKYFKHEPSNGHLQFSGHYYFIDISNQKRANSRINRNRLIAYYGSRMHFLRALFTDSIMQENYEILNIESDSSDIVVSTDPMQAEEIRLTVNADSMTLYRCCPAVIKYGDNHPELYPLPHVYKSRSYYSVIRLNDTVQVYKNGYYSDIYNISWGGHMANDRIAEMLPYDFRPKPYGRMPKQPKPRN